MSLSSAVEHSSSNSHQRYANQCHCDGHAVFAGDRSKLTISPPPLLSTSSPVLLLHKEKGKAQILFLQVLRNQTLWHFDGHYSAYSANFAISNQG